MVYCSFLLGWVISCVIRVTSSCHLQVRCDGLDGLRSHPILQHPSSIQHTHWALVINRRKKWWWLSHRFTKSRTENVRNLQKKTLGLYGSVKSALKGLCKCIPECARNIAYNSGQPLISLIPKWYLTNLSDCAATLSLHSDAVLRADWFVWPQKNDVTKEWRWMLCPLWWITQLQLSSGVSWVCLMPILFTCGLLNAPYICFFKEKFSKMLSLIPWLQNIDAWAGWHQPKTPDLGMMSRKFS